MTGPSISLGATSSNRLAADARGPARPGRPRITDLERMLHRPKRRTGHVTLETQLDPSHRLWGGACFDGESEPECTWLVLYL